MRALVCLILAGFIVEKPASPRIIPSAAPSHSRPSLQPSIREPHFPSMDEVVASAGLRPLKDTPLRSGNRELRIWFGGGFAWPQDLFRFQIKNGVVEGQWIRYWSVAIDEDMPPEVADFGAVVKYNLAGRCDAIRTLDRTAVCIARFTKRPDWNALLGKIESEGVWTLPDSKDLPKEQLPNGMQVIVNDGYEMIVEARDGANYRSYTYNNPESKKQDAAKHAAAISAAFNSIGRLVPPSKNTRIFRGRYTPAPEYSRFINCGDTTTWGLSLAIDPPPVPRNSASDSLPDTIRSAYAEVRGMKMYPSVVKVREAPYPEVIEADSILVLKPWRPEECR